MEGVYTLLLLGEHYKRNYNLPILFELSLIWVLYLFFFWNFFRSFESQNASKSQKPEAPYSEAWFFFMDYVNYLVFGKSKS